MKNQPTVSVLMTTFNAEATLDECLKSVREQNYPQNKIEIVIADGGSKDRTLTIAKKYHCKIVNENTGSAEAAKAIALNKCKNEIILELASDNVLPNKNWLSKTVSFFEKEKNITGVYPLRYTYIKNDTPLNRYFSLFGVNDPVAYFLKKADRQDYLSKEWSLSGSAVDKGDYYVVTFTTQNLPTVGANGFLIKRELLKKAKVEPVNYFHIDVNWDLVNLGFNRYIVVKNDIIHKSGESILNYFKKRRRYMEGLYLKELSRRRYHVYNKKSDREKIILFSLYALTLLGPFLKAFQGYKKLPDPAWFLHPLICFVIFWIYFLSVLNWQFWNRLGIIKRKLYK